MLLLFRDLPFADSIINLLLLPIIKDASEVWHLRLHLLSHLLRHTF